MPEPLLFEISSPGRQGYSLPVCDVPEMPLQKIIPPNFQRQDEPDLPELSELDVMRHFIHLSILNHHVDKGFYPLGSCTMKYNPKINENLARLEGFTCIHPFQEEEEVEGALQLMGELCEYISELTGMDSVTLQPAAGAHGEMTGIKIMRAYHESKGNPRKKIILPDSAHGTNPASATISGYDTVQIKSTEEGLVDLKDLKAHLDEEVAGFMLTNPNTLGLFESQILEIADAVHKAGALLYMDGANMNALFGVVRPGDIGFDIVHLNLHKTFSTPHGGGGPGSGPVAVTGDLKDFLPIPHIIQKNGQYHFDWDRPKSIGKIQGFYGNFLVMLKAYVYIRMLGSQGLKRVTENAILNANYLMRSLEKHYLLPHKQHHMHEFVLSGDRQKEKGVKTLDIAKRLLDYGFHAPTVYFPLIVHEALMVEPTETESKETLDAFAEAMIAIALEVNTQKETILNAPVTTPVRRLDEGRAARDLNIKYSRETG
ncbi:MAG TPA: glycine dehydrogenase subunit 2 [bacterium]|nr:glycine dehydrogenase subunit 2 [bacterium]